MKPLHILSHIDAFEYCCYISMMGASCCNILYGVWWLLMTIMVFLLRSLVLVIHIIFFSWCKGHVNTHDVIIVIFSHVWTFRVTPFMYIIPSFWALDVMLSQICNAIVLGDWCKHDSLMIETHVILWIYLKRFVMCSRGAWSI